MCLSRYASLALFGFDTCLYVYVGIRHFEKGDVEWCLVTALFICAPLIIAFVFLAIEKYNEKICTRLKYIQALHEDPPQWCLQVYIMLLEWEFPPSTILSCVVSLMSLTWAATSYKVCAVGGNVGLPFKIAVFISELSGFLSRLSVIAVFAYVFGRYVFALLFAHVALVMIILFILSATSQESSDAFDMMKKCCPLFSLFVAFSSFPLLFHQQKPFTLSWFEGRENSKTCAVLCYILIIIENIIMLLLIVTVAPTEINHMDEVRPFVIACVTVGMSLNLCFFPWRSC